MKKIVFLALASVLVLAACKKKKNDPAPVDSGSTSTPSTFTDYNGLLRVYNIYSKTLGSSTPAQLNFRSGYVYFATSLITASTTTIATTYGGRVIVNTDTLPWDGSVYSWNYTTPPGYTVANWNVAGSGTISAFTATCSEVFPTLTDYSTIPAIVSKSAGVTFTINGITNADKVTVQFGDGNGNAFSHVATFSGTSASVTFPASETATFTNGTLGYYTVYAYNEEFKTVNTKVYKFSNCHEESIYGITINN